MIVASHPNASSRRRRFQFRAPILIQSLPATLAIGALLMLAGCGSLPGIAPNGGVTVTSMTDDPVRLINSARTAIYRYRDANTVTVVLSDLPIADLRAGRLETGQIIAMDMFWAPQAGATPVDETATNCAARLVLFANGAAGVYGGGGFMTPRGEIGGDELSASILDATLTLLESSSGFRDLLGAATLRGGFIAERNDAAVSDIAIQVNSAVSRRMGRLSFVISD